MSRAGRRREQLRPPGGDGEQEQEHDEAGVPAEGRSIPDTYSGTHPAAQGLDDRTDRTLGRAAVVPAVALGTDVGRVECKEADYEDKVGGWRTW